MSWRGKYVGWYRLLENEFSKHVPKLTDNDVMECVTPDDVLIIPTVEEDKPRNQRKALPNLTLKLTDDSLETRISYMDRESVELLRNIFRESQKAQLETLLKELGSLDPSYETILYSQSRDEPKPRLVRKYVSARLDRQLIERLMDESDSLRKGGRQANMDSSVYIHPENPEIVFVRQSTGLDQFEFIDVLKRLHPIYRILVSVKTQRELISDRLSKPRQRRNLYRDFIEALNEARSKDLISAADRRRLNDQWRKDEDYRETLLEDLKALLNPVE